MAKTKAKPRTAVKPAPTQSTGHVSQVIGAVVDVSFPDHNLPAIMEAITVSTASGRQVVMEVEQQTGDNTVR
ncbi:MAG: F0F1 ATP synthase subunit beta, partial [Candidatus Dormibacteraceae bacterium]